MGDQPNGKEKQNYVALDLDRNNGLSGSLYDVGWTALYCVVCSVSGKYFDYNLIFLTILNI